MGLLSDLVGHLLWLVWQMLLEVVLQTAFQLAIGFIGYGILRLFHFRGPVTPTLAMIGCASFGAAAGALSTWPFPSLFIEAGWVRWLNLVFTPVAVGAITSAIGAWRRHRDMRVIKLDFFGYGYCFALAMATVRFVMGY